MRKAPTKTVRVGIVQGEQDHLTTVKFYDKNDHCFETSICLNIDARYPSFKRAIHPGEERVKKDQLFFDQKLMNDVCNEFKDILTFRWDVYDDKLICRSIPDVTVVVMLVRDKNEY